MTTVIVPSKRHGCLTQALWFIFIGWWAGQLWILVAWMLMLTILGIPFAVMMLNKLPQVIALRETSRSVTIMQVGDAAVIAVGDQVPQHNMIVRALYFILIGWWFSAIWMELAYIACLTLIGMPLGFWMFDKVPAVVSLRR